MDKQLHQLVVASVVALLTSGTITLVGLSAADEMQHTMDGGSTYTPPPDSGTSYQQPSGTTYTAPTNTNTAPVYQDSGTIYHQKPAGDLNRNTSTSTQTQPYGEHRMDSWTNDTKGVTDNTWAPHGGKEELGGFKGAGFQKDGAGFHKGAGAPDFGGKTGEGRSFRDGFGDKEGAERAGGRFDRKGGFDHEGGVLGGATNKMMHGAPGGSDKGSGDHEPPHSLPSFDSAPQNSQVSSFLDSITPDSGADVTLTTAEDQKVTALVKNADQKAVQDIKKIEGLLDDDPTKAKVKKMAKYILDLYKHWSTLFQLSNALDGAGAGGSSVERAAEIAENLGQDLMTVCNDGLEWGGKALSKTKAAKACDAADEALNATDQEDSE